MANNITTFAETNFRNQRKRFGIKQDDRRRHMYLIGKTGMGKTTVMENMIISDIRNGQGLAVVDPHGDLVEHIIKHIPNDRINDVVYFNPGDLEFPIAFNILESVDPALRHLVASGLIGVFKKIWADSWGPRLEYLLRNAILALLDYPGATLLGILRLFVDKSYRKKVIEKIEDPVVKSFWVDEYSKYPDKFQTEAISPIQNKVGQFLSVGLIRNIVGQVKSTIDMRDIMDNQKILLMNLSKGRVGEDNSGLLGAMMITKIQLAAMGRIDTPEAERKDFYLYVDEFQNFATDSFANILSEARKYRLNLTMAHQYMEQLSDVVRPAVFGNVGTIASFRVGALDAEELEKEFTPRFLAEDIVNLAKYDMYLKLMIDGIASEPFSATGLPPIPDIEQTGNEQKIIKVSRERYTVPRAVIEEKISKWAASGPQVVTTPPKKAAIKKTAPAVKTTPAKLKGEDTAKSKVDKPSVEKIEDMPDASKELYQTDCSNCQIDVEIPFKPDGVRPVYCKDCLSLARSQKAKLESSSPSPVVTKEVPAPKQKFKPKLEQVPKPIQEKVTPTKNSKSSTKVNEPVKEISLAEATSKQRSSFNKNKESTKKRPSSNVQPKKDLAPKSNLQTPSSKQTKLKPGEVIKFAKN